MSIAQATIIGNLGKKPEIKQAGDKKFARFSLAVNRKVKGEQKTAWFDVVCWDEKKAELLEQYADKGTKLFVQGDLERREYEKQDGSKGVAYEIVLGRFGGVMQLLPNGNGGSRDEGGEAGSSRGKASNGGGTQIPDDEVPW